MVAWAWLAACRKDEPTDGRRDEADADTDADVDTDTDLPPAPETFLRFVHVAEPLGALDVWIDGEVRPLARGFTGPGGTAFRAEEPGRRTLVIAASGTSPTTDALARLEADLADRARTTLVAYGAPGAVGFVAVPEDVSDLAQTDVRYAFFAAVPGRDAVRVTFGDTTVAAPYGERVALVDLPPAARDVSVDLDGDGVPDCTVTVRGVQGGTVAALYLASSGGVPTVFGHDAQGRFRPMDGPDPVCDVGGGSGGSGGAGGSGASSPRHSGGSGAVP